MSAVDDRLIRELRDAGLVVRKVKGWQSRGRDGTWAPRGVLNHHTASNRASGPAPALGICTHGRSDLPGPLCNFLLSRPQKVKGQPRKRSVVYVVAAGRANHAGYGGPLKGIPKDAGNGFLYGIEAENDGIGEEWPETMLADYATLNAVLLRRAKRTQYMSIAHHEWTDRKIDPKGIIMDAFRKRVRKTRRRLKKKGRRR